MLKWIQKMRNDKRTYRALMARGKALPSEYRFVFRKAQDYMWMHSDSEGSGMLQTMQALVELFEESATVRTVSYSASFMSRTCIALIFA